MRRGYWLGKSRTTWSVMYHSEMTLISKITGEIKIGWISLIMPKNNLKRNELKCSAKSIQWIWADLHPLRTSPQILIQVKKCRNEAALIP